MKLLPLPRPPAPPRGTPRRSRRRPTVRALLVAAALSALSLAGVHTRAYAAGGAPFGGTPAPVPGTVQAANYDTGGQGVAYGVVSANGSADSYRSDGIDLETTADTQDTGAAGGAYDMGWTTPGQWFTYTVDAATAGNYTVSFRVASPYGLTDALHIANAAGSDLTGAVAVPNTGGYETWTTVTAAVTLPAGRQTLTVDQDTNGWNFHYLAFAQGSDGGGGTGGTGGTGPTEYCGTQDLALDQPTTASSTQDAVAYPASGATDGDPGTRWSSAAGDPQWLEVDLGARQQICGVGIRWEAAYGKAFQVQVSDDNATWTTVYSTTAGTGGNQTFTASVTARYVRMAGTARGTSFGYSIFEFDVYGLTTVAPVGGGNGNGGNGVCPWVGSTAPVAQRVQQVLDTMDRAEEVTLASGDGSSAYIGQVAGIPDLCVPSLNLEDGPSGVGDGNGGVTAFPDGENAAATWDPALVGQEGAAKGAEFAGKGANVSLGPTANLVRDPRWGRTYETYGEDPYLAGQITSAEVGGLQSQGVMAEVKHAAAYDQERYPNGGDNETVSQKALEELYLAPFRTAIEQSAPGSVMCSYAVVNGAPSCASADMLQNGLDQQADYGGFVVSDWGAAGNAVADAEGGMDIAMPFSDASDVAAALAAGTLDQGTLNAIVARILTQMFAFGLFDNAPTGSLSATVTSAAHQQTALKLGEEGTVLLKNNGLLPLNPDMTGSIAVIGTDGGAAVELAGGGSGGVDSANTVWPLTGVQNAVGPNVRVTYTAGDDNGTADIPQAVAAAQAATDAIVYVSAPEGEESDLATLDLSSADETMINAVAAANPHTVVVVNSGSPVVMPWLDNVAGVFENWYGGGETGAATAALIFGTADPSGKLPVTFPGSLSQVPAQTTAQWPGTPTGPVYSEGVDIGYRWYQSQNITPAFPFGFGLSYTTFSFSNLDVGAFTADGKATVTATVTNTGSVAGADVAQMYVGDPAAAQDPPEQLSGFQRVTLSPGQSATVTFPLTVHDLASWSAADNQWEAPAGAYSIKVGDASNHLPLTGSTSLAQTLTGQVAAGASAAGVSLTNTAVSANVTANSGVPGAETVGVVNPFGYSSPKGKAVSFALQAVDSNASQTLTFTATGLPPGITIASNGTVSGSGGTPGTSTVTVTATDSRGVSGSATFVWSVTQ
ncbi:glycoside hydrolase family 3 C-terminal domain-containing protein [Actinacidiphila sp. ITFR-21]|uniref:glycoside hydrolase family 3 C-terminal domain-containing protein n=1 Tax=Actinacidiphila sp. ITFR-21 TaxID=3075199 RepID=UPI00288BC041|nr:glycoside hydrolase family 3 C-terminal domain-containing protein [Streptomyces sp. ITFR-21]WNI16398.1 glycoside hydrolase family 3 C-terminal domain-containing protein [Streptomyces sp. ITFR-21]